jgi:hypothetical protein
LKKLVIICLLQVAAYSAWAQLGYNYNEYSVGLGAGTAKPYVDIPGNKGKLAFNANFTYHHTPFANFGIQWQMGNLAAGGSESDTTGLKFNNSFSAFILEGHIQAGELIDYNNNALLNAVKNFYVGSGVGFIFNNITSIERFHPTDPELSYPGDDKSRNLLVPIKIGYEFKVFNDFDEPQLRVDIAYQRNIVFGEGMSGYILNNSPNYYSYFSVGLKYGIGSITSYRKAIKY